MSEFLITADSGTGPYPTSEHYFRRVLLGDVQGVRLRLINALERLDYNILDDGDDVVRGRRGARGWAASHSSANVLDYPVTLIVRSHALLRRSSLTINRPSLP